jgi:hypothetical protein
MKTTQLFPSIQITPFSLGKVMFVAAPNYSPEEINAK